jgi:hypothetical protein
MQRNNLSRRQFLTACAGVATATLLGACVPAAPPSSTTSESSAAVAVSAEASQIDCLFHSTSVSSPYWQPRLDMFRGAAQRR